jgi:glycosyltransferase involved in cell wall biosynthesis
MNEQHVMPSVRPAHQLATADRSPQWGNSVSLYQRGRIGLRLLKARIVEWMQFDAEIVRQMAALAGMLAGTIVHRANNLSQAFRIYGTLHRSGCSDIAGRAIERRLRADRRFLSVYREHGDALRPTPRTATFFQDPGKLLGSLAIVVKSASPDEKGVIIILYSYVFPLFAKLFDVAAISKRYHIVLEPSWAGYCDLDVLCYAQYDFPVFVQGYERRDEAFVRGTAANLVMIPTGNNWWADHRLFKPLPGVQKDIDIVMIAGWGAYKRHAQFFAALRTLRKRQITPKVLLMGYALGMTREDILGLATFYGVDDQIEWHENLSRDQVNFHLNRAKVNILWSRKEGQNRAVIEGMLAGVPCIMREGHNYGDHYAFINNQTGCFSTEASLPDTIIRMIDTHASFAPREWVMANMSCQRATQVVSDAVGQVARARGESWSGELAVKLNGLDRQSYWDEESDVRFAADYASLRTALRG